MKSEVRQSASLQQGENKKPEVGLKRHQRRTYEGREGVNGSSSR